ncbi:MAG: hypothetical protein IVW54_01970 [Candidatus Binataceae bacterium]|nr:hypothetical protein [Candidatus Binataceae bacterium]
MAAISLVFAAVPSFAQQNNVPLQLKGYSKTIPWHGVTNGATNNEAAAPMNGTASSSTIPLWQFSINSPIDGNTYTGQMVGRSPFFHGARTTNIPTIVVPLIIQMSDGTTFDPTATNSTCTPTGIPLTLFNNSPIFQSASFTFGGTNAGTGQYVDVFQRANFWTNVNVTGSRYHTALAPVTTLAAVTINVPSNEGQAFSVSACGHSGKLGVVNVDWLDNYISGSNGLISRLGGTGSSHINPTTFPIFLMWDVVMSWSTPPSLNACCYLGYHSSANSPVQTYATLEFDTTGVFPGVSDASVAAHEVGEWMDDPDGSNPTPAWGHVGQVSSCQNNLEDGDPLSGTPNITKKMSNNVTYNLQELAFYSWFFRQNPSLGVNGWFSDNGTFTTDAGPVC